MSDFCCFSGVGIVSMCKASDYLAGTASLIDVGNCTKIDLDIKDRIIGGIQDRQSISGGKACETRLIDGINGAMDLACFKNKNIELALFGKTSTTAANAAVSETYCAYKGGVINLSKSPATPANIVVKGFGATATTTYALGVDYTLNDYGNGIVIPITSSIPAVVVSAGIGAKNITITYSALATAIIDFGTSTPENFYIEIAGYNLSSKIKNEAAYLTRLFECTLSPAEVFSLVNDSDNNSKLSIKFSMLPNKTMQTLFNSQSSWGQLIKAL